MKEVRRERGEGRERWCHQEERGETRGEQHRVRGKSGLQASTSKSLVLVIYACTCGTLLSYRESTQVQVSVRAFHAELRGLVLRDTHGNEPVSLYDAK